MRTVHATTSDLKDWTGVQPGADAERVLRRASEEIDRLLLCARYDTDEHGRPTDPAVSDALRDATCELVSWWEETGDEHGAMAVYQSVSIGGVALSRGGNGEAPPRIGPHVVTVLVNAGLLSDGPESR